MDGSIVNRAEAPCSARSSKHLKGMLWYRRVRESDGAHVMVTMAPGQLEHPGVVSGVEGGTSVAIVARDPGPSILYCVYPIDLGIPT